MFNSLFGSVEVLFFVPNKVTNKGSHIRDGLDMKRTMITVWFALFPALIFGMYNVGLQYSLSSTATVAWLGNTLASDLSMWQMFLFGLVKFIPLFLISFGVGLGVVWLVRGHHLPHTETQSRQTSCSILGSGSQASLARSCQQWQTSHQTQHGMGW